MAEQETNEQAAEKKQSGGGLPRKVRMLLKLLLPVGIVIVGVLAGYIVSGLGAASPQQADAALQGQEPAEPEEKGEQDQYAYKPLEDLSVNFDTPERLRYLSVIFVIKMRSEDKDIVAKAVDDHMPELRSWLNLYLSDQAIDEISGGRNQNRIRRRVQDKFNEMIWPDARPMISEVLCERWIIQ